jgi:hypothetical protein
MNNNDKVNKIIELLEEKFKGISRVGKTELETEIKNIFANEADGEFIYEILVKLFPENSTEQDFDIIKTKLGGELAIIEGELILPSNKFNLPNIDINPKKHEAKRSSIIHSIKKKAEETINMVYPCNTKKNTLEGRTSSTSPIKLSKSTPDDYFSKILKQTTTKKPVLNELLESTSSRFKGSTDTTSLGATNFTINRKIEEIYSLMNTGLKANKVTTATHKPLMFNRYDNRNDKYLNRSSVGQTSNTKEIFNATDKEVYLQSIKKNLEHFNHKKQEIQNNRKDHFASFDEKIEQLKRKVNHENEADFNAKLSQVKEAVAHDNRHKIEPVNKIIEEQPRESKLVKRSDLKLPVEENKQIATDIVMNNDNSKKQDSSVTKPNDLNKEDKKVKFDNIDPVNVVKDIPKKEDPIQQIKPQPAEAEIVKEEVKPVASKSSNSRTLPTYIDNSTLKKEEDIPVITKNSNSRTLPTHNDNTNSNIPIKESVKAEEPTKEEIKVEETKQESHVEVEVKPKVSSKSRLPNYDY